MIEMPRGTYYYKPKKRDRETLIAGIEAIVVEFSPDTATGV